MNFIYFILYIFVPFQYYVFLLMMVIYSNAILMVHIITINKRASTDLSHLKGGTVRFGLLGVTRTKLWILHMLNWFTCFTHTRRTHTKSHWFSCSPRKIESIINNRMPNKIFKENIYEVTKQRRRIYFRVEKYRF